MIIGIVLDPYGEKKVSGLGHYILELTQNLLAIDQKNTYLIFTKGMPETRPPLPGTNWRLVPLGFGKLWRDLGFIFAPKADIYLFVTPVLPIWYRLKRTIVVTHDFPYQRLAADTWQQRLLKPLLDFIHRRSLQRADRIVAISQYTQQEDIELFGADERKIKVIYNGFRNVGAVEPKKLNISQPYFVTVGAVKERKNTLRMVQAFATVVRQNNLPHRFVIVGKTGNRYSERLRDYIATEKLADRIIFFGHANDAELSYLYRQAEALVFAGLIESFGFPVLEAMSCGLPVITSKVGGVAEVAGDAALLVDPENVEEIAQAMVQVSTNHELRADLVRRGYERAKLFSWQKTAKQFLVLIERLVSE